LDIVQMIYRGRAVSGEGPWLRQTWRSIRERRRRTSIMIETSPAIRNALTQAPEVNFATSTTIRCK
jgi:hypothetical protein